MTKDTYSVSLTFREWMDVSTALGITEKDYRERGFDGQANKYKAVQEAITAEITEQ